MKAWKRFAAALLAAGMVLAMLTACSGGSAAVKWENSRTKQYLENKGITASEYTLKAKCAYAGLTGNLVYTVKGKQWYADATALNSNKTLKDAKGNYYISRPYSGSDTWYKYPANSEYASSYELIASMLTIPTKDNVGSIAVSDYTMNGKTYYMETMRIHQNNTYMTYSYGFLDNELSFVLVESTSNVMLTSIDLKKTADANLLKVPTNYISEGVSGGSAGMPSGGAAASSASAQG